MNVAIMQPCYLPWRGYFALMRRCDVFVHLDDAALPTGRSYQTRIALKAGGERRWLSVPVRRRRGTLIHEAEIDGDAWRRKHAATLAQELPDAFSLVADLFERTWTHLAPLNIALAERIAGALEIERPTFRSRDLDTGAHASQPQGAVVSPPGARPRPHDTRPCSAAEQDHGTRSATQATRAGDLHTPDAHRGSERILSLCRALGATRYLTGHGGRKYLDHERFEDAGIEVLYLDYDLTGYPQPHGPFDPFVTVLDVIEYVADPLVFVDAEPVPWRAFLERPVGATRPERG